MTDSDFEEQCLQTERDIEAKQQELSELQQLKADNHEKWQAMLQNSVVTISSPALTRLHFQQKGLQQDLAQTERLIQDERLRIVREDLSTLHAQRIIYDYVQRVKRIRSLGYTRVCTTHILTVQLDFMEQFRKVLDNVDVSKLSPNAEEEAALARLKVPWGITTSVYDDGWCM